jgi:hypothetical protein
MVRTHEKSKSRVWQKMHLAEEPKSHETILCELTQSGCHDAPAAASILVQLEDTIERDYAGGAYDDESARAAIAAVGARAVNPRRLRSS